MIPKEFKQQNKTLVGPKGSNIQPLPVFCNGSQVTSCWTFSEEEWAELSKTRSLYLTVYSGETSPPVWIQVKPPFFENDDAFTRIYYTNITTASKPDILVWIAADIEAPKVLKIDGDMYLRDLIRPKVIDDKYRPQANSYYIRETYEGDEREAFGEQYALIYLALNNLEGLIPIPKEQKVSSK